MADPTLAELAARVQRLETALGLGPITPTPDPAPPPTPTPVPQVPSAPTGLHGTMLGDDRPQLDWDLAPRAENVINWDVADLLNTADPIKETVTVPRSIRSAVKPGSRRRMAVRARNAAGVSPWSAPLDLPLASPAPAPTPVPSGPVPGGLLDLSRWYLTLPIADPSGKDTSGPWDVYQPELNTFAHPDYFRVGSTITGQSYVEYVAPVKGVSTSNSGAARSELREMTGPKPTDKASWSFLDGKPHMLTCTLTCDGTSIDGRKEVIVGQIHGPGGTPPLILCVNHTRGGALEVFRQGPRQGDLLTGLQPGEKFTYRIDASGGRLRLYACRGGVADLPAQAGFDWHYSVLSEQSGLYFKAGVYGKQEISTATTGQSVVRHFRLELI